jgi:hypothetical protein
LAGQHGNAFGTLPAEVDETAILSSVVDPLVMTK